VWAGESLPLAGTWQVALDAAGGGHTERWYERRLDGDTIFLPGSLDQGGFGVKTVVPDTGWLTRPFQFAGAAWYQRRVVIPEEWRGRRITVFLERVHWRSELWVDGRAAGMSESLSTPHEYETTALLTPGAHLLTLCVDNRYLIDVGRDAHSIGDHTQTNWNGVIGRMEIRAGAPQWVDDVRITPEPGAGRVRVTGTVRALAGTAAAGELSVAVSGLAGAAARIEIAKAGPFEVAVPVPGARRWDEWDGAVYTMSLDFADDRKQIDFGLREIGTRGTQFVLNGRPIFIRGTLECAIWPLTGYAPADVESWERVFRIARSYGMNAFRFHSYTPPEAAFVAADRAGFLLQVELPVWSHNVGRDAVRDEFMRAEGYRILREYGNHPSFTMLCMGNELRGDDKFIDALVAEFKAADGRRLYTFSADHRRRAPGPTSDFYETHQTGAGRLRINNTRFGATADGTNSDFSASVKAVGMPLVAHELGQWAVFPSFDEIGEYTGVLKARNLEAFRDSLAAHGLAGREREFARASGRFAWSVYKEEMEAALRTQGLGGYFLLQLEDFPGQGEALVGLLDSFWNSKGIMAPEEFRRFNDRTVALARMEKFVWRNTETLVAKAEVAHYGREDVAGAEIHWRLVADGGDVVGSGSFPALTLRVGSETSVGEIRVDLAKVWRASHLRLTIEVARTEIENDWDIWVYPPAAASKPASNMLITKTFDAAARDRLAAGGTVLVHGVKGSRTEPIRFLPVFWSKAWGSASFTGQPAVMGAICDPKHPALEEFPNAGYTQWQWWELMEGGRAFILDGMPAGLQPVVGLIDDFHFNRRLGAVVEARVGPGRLIATSFDLGGDPAVRPVARQMLQSLLDYAAGAAFHPRQVLSVEDAARLIE
jgi:hypothetical protein